MYSTSSEQDCDNKMVLQDCLTAITVPPSRVLPRFTTQRSARQTVKPVGVMASSGARNLSWMAPQNYMQNVLCCASMKPGWVRRPFHLQAIGRRQGEWLEGLAVVCSPGGGVFSPLCTSFHASASPSEHRCIPWLPGGPVIVVLTPGGVRELISKCPLCPRLIAGVFPDCIRHKDWHSAHE